ncbi:MAG TPA: hypothetical protein VLM43_13015 [Desulfobacterales bacterium]|nr:hypothetical protein [Desulfobacterales bacterium]
MLEEVKIDTENQLMRVQFGSDSTVENWKSALMQVERLSEETGLCRVLVDVRKQKYLANTITLFDFAVHLPRSIAFAVLCELRLEDHRFIENVAKNRGIIVKDFDSEQNAIEWLKGWPNKSINSDKK